MDADKDGQKVPDMPTDQVQTWLTYAVVAFVFSVIFFVFAAFWTFEKEGQEAVFRAQAFAPFGVAVAAIVTFFTVVWRGVLTTKQLDLQAAQLRHQNEQLTQVIRQNNAKEDENLIRLLQDGAKFIAEDSKEPQIMAGVASLDALISNDPKRLFSVQAMDILANYYAKNYLDEKDTVISARRALNRAAEAGVTATVGATFRYDENKRYDWPIVRGFRFQSYFGGTMTEKALEAVAKIRSFNKVNFRYCDIRGSRYLGCHFVNCNIIELDAVYIAKNTFENCNFSGCKIDGFTRHGDIRATDLGLGLNFYYDDNPPTYTAYHERMEIKWTDILIEKPASERPNGSEP